MRLPPPPGPGPYPLSLDNAAFYVLLVLILLLIFMLLVLRNRHPRAKRAIAGYVEATWVDLAFLAFAVVLVVALVTYYPHANRTAYALYEVILQGYWLAFSIPVVTVGSSVHSRSEGTVPWLLPSILVAVGLFVVFFEVYFTAP